MSIFERVVVEEVRKPTTTRPGQYLVKLDGAIVGLLEKYKNSRTDIHPWKAFAGIGKECKYLEAFYEPGARIRARNKVLEAVGVLGGEYA